MINMMSKSLFFLSVYILLLQYCSIILAQSATAPAPPGPTNITQILEKAGQFTTLMKLMKTTQVSDQINTQLNNSNQGMTLFAPTDNAFSSLKAGTLNSLSDQQKTQLLQFHIISNFLSMSQFQTVSNPLTTQAGNSNPGQFPLNVTTSGNQVNISTGFNEATIGNTIYTDNQLAVYQVDKVLLPLAIFDPSAPAPAPTAAKPKKPPVADSPTPGGSTPVDASGAVGGLAMHGVLSSTIGVAFLAAFWL